jgi:hypothetical protein
MLSFKEIDAIRDAAVAEIAATMPNTLITREEAEAALLRVGASPSVALSMRQAVYHKVNLAIMPHIKTSKALREAVAAAKAKSR